MLTFYRVILKLKAKGGSNVKLTRNQFKITMISWGKTCLFFISECYLPYSTETHCRTFAFPLPINQSNQIFTSLHHRIYCNGWQTDTEDSLLRDWDSIWAGRLPAVCLHFSPKNFAVEEDFHLTLTLGWKNHWRHSRESCT